MLKIGITGGIGSGKTMVTKLFAILGAPVYDADTEAKKLMNSNPQIIAEIRKNFGDVYNENNQLNRAKLASIVFNDDAKLQLLNKITHPPTIKAYEDWAKLYQNKPYVIKEAALLFESNSYQLNDYNILVVAPEDIKIQRVMDRDGVTKEQVLSRMKNQMPDSEKIKLADSIIFNDNQTLLIPQVLELHEQFISEA